MRKAYAVFDANGVAVTREACPTRAEAWAKIPGATGSAEAIKSRYQRKGWRCREAKLVPADEAVVLTDAEVSVVAERIGADLGELLKGTKVTSLALADFVRERLRNLRK